MKGFASSYYILPCLVICLKSLFCSNERQKGTGSEGEGDRKELGGTEGRETIIKILHMRKEFIFNNK